MNMDLLGTGVLISSQINSNGYMMAITALPYLLIQVPSMFYMGLTPEQDAAGINIYALIACFTCIGFFMRYLYLQYQGNDEDESKERVLQDIMIEAINEGKISLKGIMYNELKMSLDAGNNNTTMSRTSNSNNATEKTYLSSTEKSINRLKSILKPFFNKYDADGNGNLDVHELTAVFNDLGEIVPHIQMKSIFNSMDTDHSGTVSYDEFVKGVFEYVLRSALHRQRSTISNSKDMEKAEQMISNAANMDKNDNEEEVEEEEEMPEDLQSLSPEEQQRHVIRRAIFMLSIGTLLVLVFSDPMVSVLSEVGNRTGISPFYISFIFAPLASNASEVIASYNYALKKTSQSITISLSALEGACVMNNTFVMAIFMLMVYMKALPWVYFAETCSILTVIIIMTVMTQKKVHTVQDAWMILSLYPMSLLLVYFIESMGFN